MALYSSNFVIGNMTSLGLYDSPDSMVEAVPTCTACIFVAIAQAPKSETVEQSTILQWRHNERDGVSNHQPHDWLLNRLFKRRSKKISKLRITGLCERNSPVTSEVPAQTASNEENVSIWWRHQEPVVLDSFFRLFTSLEVHKGIDLCVMTGFR